MWRISELLMLSPSGLTQGGCNVMASWLQHSLFTDMADDILSPSLKTELQSLTWSAEPRQLCTRGDKKENPQGHGNLEACQKGICSRSLGCLLSPELIYTALFQAVG